MPGQDSQLFVSRSQEADTYSLDAESAWTLAFLEFAQGHEVNYQSLSLSLMSTGYYQMSTVYYSTKTHPSGHSWRYEEIESKAWGMDGYCGHRQVLFRLSRLVQVRAAFKYRGEPQREEILSLIHI